jgi:hypothetical protein
MTFVAKLALVMALVVLGGCGPGPQLSITVQPLAGGIDYKMWLFGASVSCAATASSPTGRTALEGSAACGNSNPDTGLCFMQLDQVLLNTTFRFDSITPGSRAIFGIERDSGLNAIGWACAPVTVTAGNASSVTLTFQAN